MRWLLLIAIVLISLLIGRAVLAGYRYHTVAICRSHDESLVATLRSQSMSSRHLTLEVVHVRTGEHRFQFDSPDESYPADTEHMYWSNDDRWLLITGRRFATDPTIKCNDAGTAYLLVDLKTKSQYSNSSQSKLPNIDNALLEMAGFGFLTK